MPGGPKAARARAPGGCPGGCPGGSGGAFRPPMDQGAAAGPGTIGPSASRPPRGAATRPRPSALSSRFLAPLGTAPRATRPAGTASGAPGLPPGRARSVKRACSVREDRLASTTLPPEGGSGSSQPSVGSLAPRSKVTPACLPPPSVTRRAAANRGEPSARTRTANGAATPTLGGLATAEFGGTKISWGACSAPVDRCGTRATTAGSLSGLAITTVVSVSGPLLAAGSHQRLLGPGEQPVPGASLTTTGALKASTWA